MNHLVTEELSQEQIFIIKLRINNVGYGDIITEFQKKFQKRIYDCKISTCLRRAAMGYCWTPGNLGGNDPYLCKHDLNDLKETIIDYTNKCIPMDCQMVLDEAKSIKMHRLFEGIEFLLKANSKRLSNDLSDFIVDEPSRSWINGIIDELDVHIINQRLIDQKRLDSCSIGTIQNFFNQFSNFISQFHPMMIFGADETMLDPLPRKKVVVPKEIQVILHENLPDMAHISGMMCHNIAGVALPPFMILSKLKNLPKELIELTDSQQIYIASTESGFMTRDSFLLWTLHFVHFLTDYRSKIKNKKINKDCLLILDGHTSRENPLALTILRRSNVHVLVIPSHTSHVLQMFDCLIASPLKRDFSKFFESYLTEIQEDLDTDSMTAKVRLAAIKSFLSAWRRNCTPINAEKAARITGTYPPNAAKPLKSVFVHELTPEEQERQRKRMKRLQNRISISGQIITTEEKIISLADSIKKVKKFEHLCDLEYASSKNFFEIASDFISNPHNNTYLLSEMPSLATKYYVF